jgi:hypothetical protein
MVTVTRQDCSGKKRHNPIDGEIGDRLDRITLRRIPQSRTDRSGAAATGDPRPGPTSNGA